MLSERNWDDSETLTSHEVGRERFAEVGSGRGHTREVSVTNWVSTIPKKGSAVPENDAVLEELFISRKFLRQRFEF